MLSASKIPVPYSDSLETLEDGEAGTAEALHDVLRGITQTTSKHHGKGMRSVHAKSHAVLQGFFVIPAGLPATLAQGLFAKAGQYPLFMRISTIPGDVLDDKVSVPRGLALKVIGVEGERLPGSEIDQTQDFVMGIGPTFSVPKASKFLPGLKLLARTTDRAEWAKKVLSAVTRGAERGLEAIGQKSGLLMTFGGYPHTNPASETFFSQTPYRYGDYIAKFSLVPVSQNLKALKDVPVDLSGGPDGLRGALNRTFETRGGTWELRAQLLTDLAIMPIEDATVEWPEEVSPYVTIARVEIHAQPAWTIERAAIVDDQMAFSPWHGLTAHRPLGSINRVRRYVYQMSAGQRAEINGCPIHEPIATTSFPVN